jgi:hypothetical protein
MTHARIHHYTAGILAIATTIALALSTATTPASARTFNFNSAGSMVQQPLPTQWGCVIPPRAEWPGSQSSLPVILGPLGNAIRGHLVATGRARTTRQSD